MKTITMYEASSGARFNTAEQCREHENLIVALDEAMLPLGPERKIDSEQYFQHDKELALQAKRNVMAIVRGLFGIEEYPAMAANSDEIHPRCIIGRVIDDSGPPPLNRAWGRLSRINWENFREYEQPYFTAHPDEATQQIS
jgi:hypothetical protein